MSYSGNIGSIRGVTENGLVGGGGVAAVHIAGVEQWLTSVP